MRFTKILCPIDFSEGSRQAMRTAARIANEHDAELVLFHAWYIPPVMEDGTSILPPSVIDEIAADAKRALDDAVQEATTLGARHAGGALAHGTPWAEVTRKLEQQAFDLCVIGTHGRTGLKRIFLGSVAEKVVRHAPCSVLVVRLDSKAQPFVHALCPTDFSESARQAVALAPSLVTPAGTISLLHVTEAPVSVSRDVSLTDFVKDLDRRATAALTTEAARLQPLTEARVAMLSRVGAAGAETLAAIDADPSIDLVVMGSHGRTGIARVLLGSVAEKVVRHARCPVLVTRARR